MNYQLEMALNTAKKKTRSTLREIAVAMLVGGIIVTAFGYHANPNLRMGEMVLSTLIFSPCGIALWIFYRLARFTAGY